jgi:predicted O-methyltransferase YrrM
MSNKQWIEVDRYISDLLISHDSALDAALANSEQAGLPQINVSPNHGKMLMLLAQLMGATRILEIGTLGGYSTIWLARALPSSGCLITLESKAKHAEVARANIEAAQLGASVELRLGAALDTLPKLVQEKGDPFDLVFIDADKQNNPQYFEWSLKLCRPGSLIVVDNVVRGGAVTDRGSSEPAIQGTRKLNEILAADPRVDATIVQTVGSKGYDGFALVRVV